MKRIIKEIMELFTIGKILLILFLTFSISAFYMFLITEHFVVSVSLGILAMFFLFYNHFYLEEKLKRRFFLLKELQKYTTSMNFYMQSGHNVLSALSHSRRNLDPEIRKDIEKTMIKLEEKAILDTSHFKKYKFDSLDIFHQILNIKYVEGGDSKELFSRVNKSINFEIIKHDELMRRKHALRKQLFFFLLIVLSMALIFRFMAYDLQVIFLSMGWIAIGLNVALFVGALVSLYFIQRNATDITISR